MKRSRFTEEQTIGILKVREAGADVSVTLPQKEIGPSMGNNFTEILF